MKMHRIFAAAACLALAVVVIAVSTDAHAAQAVAHSAMPFSDGSLVAAMAMAGSALRFETKDESGGASEALKEAKKAAEAVMTAFEEFKKTNDDRLKQIEQKGAADPVTLEKLAKIEKDLAKSEEVNQKLTAAENEAKAVKERQAEMKGQIDKLELRLNRPGAGGEDKQLQKKSWNEWARGVVLAHTLGVGNLNADQQKALQSANDEWKALNVANDTAGGYLAPIEYVREIIKAETEFSPIRSLVRIRETASKSIQLPKRTGQFSAVWVAEQGTRSETIGLAYGLHEVPTHEVYALVDISQQMLEDSAFDMEAEIRQESVEQFGVAEGAAAVSGTGVGKPEGFMTNADVGNTVSGSAAVIADADGQANGLLTLKHAIKTAYARNANWVMNRTTLGSVRKLKDADKNYIWMPGIALGKPNTIDGDPYVELPDMPSEGANAFPVAYGDFRRAYVLVDRIQLAMLRDPFTQATSGNIRFIMRKRLGGQVVLAEAIRKLKCATT